ncbi:unnamed protein product [Prorocentrum cordatum]|uniref:GH18 domain-containing protein n=1 Tax=Prorocentrum cordatum TaxID=2364126 RepID=A0ABN9Q430_9DINO|nr:unnamed protein product [Polarella glacialis]
MRSCYIPVKVKPMNAMGDQGNTANRDFAQHASKEFFASRGTPKEVTMAYYPDGRQEELIKEYGIDQHVDLMHMMSYDQTGRGVHHSTLEYGLKTAKQGAEILPPLKLTLGVPFYGRHSLTGDWVTYEDLVQQHHPLGPDVNHVPVDPEKFGGEATQNFNGVKWIEEKTAFALRHGLGGVMIWEVGQDCRLVPVTHGAKTHVRTCPEDNASLLLAITRAAVAAGRAREQSSDVALPGSTSGAKGADEL